MRVPGRLLITLEILSTCDVTSLQSSGGRRAFLILRAVPTGKTENHEFSGAGKGRVSALASPHSGIWF